MKIAVAQLGARMHYAVPRIFAGSGCLTRLYTDLYAGSGFSRKLSNAAPALLPASLRKFGGRRGVGLPAEAVTSFGLLGLKYWSRLRSARSPRDTAMVHLWAGDELGRLIVKHGLAGTDTVYTYNSASLRLLRFARENGIRTLYEQTIAPVPVELNLMQEEQARWPEWETGTDLMEFYGPFLENEQEEWKLADRIICGSRFVAEGIKSCSGLEEKTRVVPYGVNLPGTAGEEADRPGKHNRLLRVLTVGTVCLRKGAPYLAAAAHALRGKAEFRVVGPVSLTETGTREMKRTLELTGPVPRSQVADHFRWADVFLLPSICEGSATTTYEALAHGLPVVTTLNSGSPVEDGENGLIVPLRAVDSIVAALEGLANDQDKLAEMSRSAINRSRSLTVAAYGTRLMNAIQE